MDLEDAPLRPMPIERDDMGRFERKGGATLKNSQKTVREPTVIEKVKITGPYKPGQSGNPKGRPKGSLNKTTVALKEAILAAGEAAGGKDLDTCRGWRLKTRARLRACSERSCPGRSTSPILTVDLQKSNSGASSSTLEVARRSRA